MSNDPGTFWFDDSPANCFDLLKENVKKKQPWCKDIDTLFDNMISASEKGNEKAYKECFENSSSNDDVVKEEMKKWKSFKLSKFFMNGFHVKNGLPSTS